MKLVVIGFGQCGGRIADQFARINKRARSQRRIEITPGVFAVNTDAADLSGLSNIKSDYRHRILIGTRKTGGHGVGKINELGAEIARDDSDKVIDAIRGAKRFYESDAFLLIASSGGGTGSGALPVLTKFIKERYVDKPLYAMVILPFEHEESTEERAIYNSALCIKSVNQVADAVFLIDNQRYIRKDFSLRNNLTKINEMIVEPFYDLLCAGEEKKTKYIGAKTVDAGDINQTLTGWTTIGHGQSDVPLFNLPLPRKSDFRTKSTEIHKGIQAMDEAMSELSITCDCSDASRALYLLAAPHKEMNMDLVKELGDYLRGIAPEATIRNGDYPRERTHVEVTLILSGLSNVEKVREYYSKSTTLIPEFKRREEETAGRLRTLEEVGKDIPTLL
ncbi:MAG: cell division protein FtsZ [Dehalococcoidia bacterium]|nr:MAG: cell division protein FtsZ [Dehalococcoidia bacterium]